MPLPETLRPYFWNCRFQDLDTSKHRKAIIEQIMEYGNLDAWRWMLRTYKEKDMIETLKLTRMLSPHSRSFWSLFFHVDLPDDFSSRNSTWQHRYDTKKA